jgi:hypothetical protein
MAVGALSPGFEMEGAASSHPSARDMQSLRPVHLKISLVSSTPSQSAERRNGDSTRSVFIVPFCFQLRHNF